MKRWFLLVLVAGWVLLPTWFVALPARAQAHEGMLSDGEVEALRDAAYVPVERIAAYSKILDTREKQIEELMAKRRHLGREEDLHDLMDQFAAIADELNDNLDEYGAKHRDVRKALPKLIGGTERWSTALRAPPEDDAYKVVRKLALDALKDMREIAEKLQVEEAAYFKAHPEAEQMEKTRTTHAPS